jgi:hypothetical protein
MKLSGWQGVAAFGLAAAAAVACYVAGQPEGALLFGGIAGGLAIKFGAIEFGAGK